MTTLITAQSLALETNHGLLFQDLSLTLHTGGRIGLIGHNGCGKSTLLALLSGTIEPAGGTIRTARACRCSISNNTCLPALRRSPCATCWPRPHPLMRQPGS